MLAIRAICRRFRITGLFILTGEDKLRPRMFYPEPDGESFNQSKTIIGVAGWLGNHPEGSRTTEVISVTA